MIKSHTRILKSLYLCLISLTFAIMVSAPVQASEDKIVVFAAASLTDALTAIAKRYEENAAIKIQTAFASSATLAKQIARGAPADIFIAADHQWMDYLQSHHSIIPNSRQDLLKNNLVLIAPANRTFKVKMEHNFAFAQQFTGRLCTGQVDAVPVGIYAKQALTYLNWWPSIKERIVGAQNVRAALVYVERGECQAGIVYETDAIISDKVVIVARFPDQSHVPIRYPIALVNNANPQASKFLAFLKSLPAKSIFEQYGFITLQ